MNLLNVNPIIQIIRLKLFKFLIFFFKMRLQNLFYYIFKRNTIYYKEQLNKRLGINKKEIQKKVNILSKIVYVNNKKFIVREKYYGLFYIEILK